jgi:hypothetical protein
MPWTIYYPFLIWGILAVPLTLLLWKQRPIDYLTSLLLLLDYALLNLFFILVVNWSLINYWLRVLPVVLTFAIALALLIKGKRRPFFPEKSTLKMWLLAALLVVLLPLAYLNYRVLLSLKHEGEHALGFLPVRNGLYVVVNGGNSLDGLALNNLAHPWLGSELAPDDSMAYGIDIMRMGIRGSTRVSGRGTRSYLQYSGFNDMVYSPCFGQVVHVEDGHPDVDVNQPGIPFGNYVVIQCEQYYFTIANLKNGSIPVKPGDQVSIQALIGFVGNSGVPSLPHLHVHATRGGWRPGEGEPVPMLFPSAFAVNKFLVRNDLYISNKE